MKILKLEIPDEEYDEFIHFMAYAEPEGYQTHIINPEDNTEFIPNPVSVEDYAIYRLEKNVFDGFVNYKRIKHLETQDIKTEIKVKK